MKSQGRPQSQNIEDQRSYFGTKALDNDYWEEDRIMDFLQDSISQPHGVMPQKLEQRAPSTLEEIILHEMTKGVPWPDETPGTGGYGAVDELLREMD